MLSVLKMSAAEACLLFLLAIVALLITADLIMVMVLKPFRQLFVLIPRNESIKQFLSLDWSETCHSLCGEKNLSETRCKTAMVT